MKDWRKSLVNPDELIRKALELIDSSSVQIALVVDNNRRLLGTVTDGDIRRGLLKGITLEHQVDTIMNPNPTVAEMHQTRDEILAMMKNKWLAQVPVVDAEGHVIALEILNELLSAVDRDNWVVLMVGGLGSRLYPLTEDCPKPLLQVGSKPILENIVENLVDYGYRKIFFAVNYKAEMIERHFGDGTRWGAEIYYLREEKKLGTAGALSLLPHRPKEPILIMNGDILTKVNFRQLFDFHTIQHAKATMCVREYSVQIPYGVVALHDQQIKEIIEKPKQHFFVSAGIYVLDPDVIELIPSGETFDMPSLFEKLISRQAKTVAFPVREYWLDIGKMSDFEKANGEFEEIFG